MVLLKQFYYIDERRTTTITLPPLALRVFIHYKWNKTRRDNNTIVINERIKELKRLGASK